MTRKKVELAYITNDSSRKSTYKKRKKGLMKKVSELSTLCGIDACAIIYSPYDSQPEVWPSPMGAQSVISQFKKMSEMEQSKKMMNQDTFLKQRISKANEQLKKQRKENRELELTRIMFESLTGKGLQGLSVTDLNDLGWLVDQNLKDIQNRIDSLNKNPDKVTAVVAATTNDGVQKKSEEMMMMEQNTQTNENYEVMNMQRQTWFMDVGNTNDQMGFGAADDFIISFEDHNLNALWSSAFFP